MELIYLVTQNGTQLFSFFDAIDTVQAVVLILGLILMVVEIFTPGFGVAGGTGLLLLVAGIIMTARNAFEAMVMVILLLLVIAVVVVFILRSARKGILAKKMILWSAAQKEQGYRAGATKEEWLGRIGTAITILRPAGSAEFEGERLDVVSQGTFIPAGTKVQIVRVEGRRVVVRAVLNDKSNVST